MIVSSKEPIEIRFVSSYENRVDSALDSSGIIPVAMLGRVLSITNRLMYDTWDFAVNNPNDDRFQEFRATIYKFDYRKSDVELGIIKFREGSLIVDIGLMISAAMMSSVAADISINLTASAIWDLTKYGFQSAFRLIRSGRESTDEILMESESDPLINSILPTIVELARVAHQSSRDGTISTEFTYKDINFTINSETQNAILQANQVLTHTTTRLIGDIVGVDYSDKRVGVRWELFPEHTFWCDVQDIDIVELNKLVLENRERNRSAKLGFDVELGWRRGAIKILPPDSIRIIRIVPPHELNNPNFSGFNEFSRLPMVAYEREVNTLSPVDGAFIKWFDWADTNWDDPNQSGIIAYLRSRKGEEILGQRLDRSDLEVLIQKLVNIGVLLMVQYRRGNNAILRLNRNHPLVVKVV